jgi:CRP-like cAMP-binding protein
MSKSSLQEDLPVLMKSKNGLVYLTTNDWTLVADKATRQKFKPGDQLVQKGRRTHGIFVLLSGSATAQLSTQAGLRNVGPGEVCGEISFLDELPATANVVANGPVEAFYLDRSTLQSLIELFPHLGSRFYHSLAAILSYRLREVLGPLGSSDDIAPPSKKNSK